MHSPITNISFNQDASSIVICQTDQLEIYSISDNCLKLENIPMANNLKHNIKDAIISERLFSSSLLIIVCRKEPRTLRVYHFRRGTEICAYSYGSNILNVKLNRMRLVVICEKAIYFHDTKDMQLLHEIKNVTFNPKGICCLSKSEALGHPLLAYSGSTRDGILHVYECDSFRMMATLAAHKTPIVAIAIHDCSNDIINENHQLQAPSPNSSNSSSTTNSSNYNYKVPNTRAILATASDTGTVVRIWAVRTAGKVEKIADLRRGTIRSAKISSLNFSEDGKWLALISDTETVHIWKIGQLLDPVTPRHSLGSEGNEQAHMHSQNSMRSDNLSIHHHPSDHQKNLSSSSSSWFSASSWTDYGKDLAKQVLPESIGHSVSAGRANITAILPNSGYRSKVAIFSEPGLDYLQILVSMMDGSLLVYEADVVGGEARYVRRHNLVETEEVEDQLDGKEHTAAVDQNND